MRVVHQSPTDPAFVQDPYAFYARARLLGDVVWWSDYRMPAVLSDRIAHALFRDRRLGRERPTPREVPGHLARWDAIERHSLLDAEPPRHTRLRKLVLRAFTSRMVGAMAGDIETLCHQLIDRFPAHTVDLLPAYCTKIPVIVIARLLGVPEDIAPDLLRWSHAMVAMYQAKKDRAVEDAADRAASAFGAFLSDYIAARRRNPKDDLLSSLIAAEEAGDTLTTEELIGTCVLLLNAGHEATVHGLGNGIFAILGSEFNLSNASPDQVSEEILRFDPPLHIFTRFAYEPVEIGDYTLQTGDEIALVIGATGRDPMAHADPDRFDPTRKPGRHQAFGGGIHFCVGAPLARLEMQLGLKVLFERCPKMTLAEQPVYADTYHFHGLTALNVRI
jgi:unspecific monooxygenase